MRSLIPSVGGGVPRGAESWEEGTKDSCEERAIELDSKGCELGTTTVEEARGSWVAPEDQWTRFCPADSRAAEGLEDCETEVEGGTLYCTVRLQSTGVH